VTKRHFVFLLPLLALFLVLMVVVPSHPDDEASYITLAKRISHGYYTTGDNRALLDRNPAAPDLWFGPGLPIVLMPLVAVHSPQWLLRATGPIFLFLAVLVFYLLVRLRGSPRTALAAAYALGLYVPFWTLLPNVHSETLAIFLVVTSAYGLARYIQDRRLRHFALGSVALAWLALTRVAFGWVITAVLVLALAWWVLRRRPLAGRVAAVYAAALLLCVPWLAYTHARTHRYFVWGNSGSLSLYWMSTPYSGDLGDWHQANQVFTDPRLRAHRAFFRRLEGLTLAQQNAKIEHQALRNIAHNPAKYAKNVAANVSRMLFNTPYSFTRENTKTLLYAFPNSLVLGAIVLSLAVFVRRRRSLPPEGIPFLLFGAVAFGLHALLSAYPRMLMPEVPIVLWFTALAVQESGLLRLGEGVVVQVPDQRSPEVVSRASKASN
jgi:4-amino-4-deoxy-L-arabinose transferase-like glycosyltransferase